MKTKLAKITKKALVETISKENLNKIEFVDSKDVVTVPNAIAVAKTAKGNFMVYMTREGGKKFNTSVHADRKAANGMVLRRMRDAQANA